MKKQLSLALLTSVILLTAVAKSSAQDEKLAHSMLWSVVFDKMPADTSYLFGTIDVISQKDFVMKDKVYNAMMKSDRLVTEHDLLNKNVQKKLEDARIMKDGETLKKILKKKDYNILNSYLLEGSGENLDDYNTTKPYFVTDALVKFFIDGTPASYTKTLLQIAQNDGMRVVGIEPVSAYMEKIDSIPYEDQAKNLVKMANDEKEMRANYQALIEAYKQEDIAKTDSLIRAAMPTEQMRKLLIDNRAVMMSILAINQLSNNRAFVALNASFLGGKTGLIYILRKTGYTVEPVFDVPEEKR